MSLDEGGFAGTPVTDQDQLEGGHIFTGSHAESSTLSCFESAIFRFRYSYSGN